MDTFDARQEAFREEPCIATARRYATELFDYWADEMIGNDTLRNGLIEITDRLTDSRNDLGQPVEIQINGSTMNRF